MDIVIRPEQLSGHQGHQRPRSFGQPNESRLVEDFRIPLVHFLVAEIEGQTAGHILFFPIGIKNRDKKFGSLALAPAAVLPEYQRQGIGSALVKAKLEK
jgi:putative acetyltransferase